MTKREHNGWMQWAASLTDAEIAAKIDHIKWLERAECDHGQIGGGDDCAVYPDTGSTALHYLIQERDNREVDARIAARRAA